MRSAGSASRAGQDGPIAGSISAPVAANPSTVSPALDRFVDLFCRRRSPTRRTASAERGWMRSEVVRLRPQTESTMKRRISGPQTLEAIEGRAWLYELAWEPGREQRVEVRLTGTATATRDDTLPEQVAMAKRTSGRSAIDWIASWRSVPPLIEIGAEWIAIHHATATSLESAIGFRRGPRTLEALRSGQGSGFPQAEGRRDLRVHLRPMDFEIASKQRPAARGAGDALRRHREDPRFPGAGRSRHRPRGHQHAPAAAAHGIRDESPSVAHRGMAIRHCRASTGRAHARPAAGYEEVEDVLDSLRTQGYVEEFGPGHWRASDYARHIKASVAGVPNKRCCVAASARLSPPSRPLPLGFHEWQKARSIAAYCDIYRPTFGGGFLVNHQHEVPANRQFLA